MYEYRPIPSYDPEVVTAEAQVRKDGYQKLFDEANSQHGRVEDAGLAYEIAEAVDPLMTKAKDADKRADAVDDYMAERVTYVKQNAEQDAGLRVSQRSSERWRSLAHDARLEALDIDAKMRPDS